MRIVRWHSLEECGRQAWDDLAARSPDATVFQQFAWMQAWWETMAMPDWRPYILAAYDGDRLAGIAPLYVRGAVGRGARSAHFIGEEHADYQCFIVADGSPTIAAELLDAVEETSGDVSCVRLDEIPQFSSLDLVLRERCYTKPLRVVTTHVTPCPRLDLRRDPALVDRILAKRSLRRHTSQLARLGQVRIRHERDADFIRAMLPVFFEQHVRRWSGTPFPSLFERSENRRFYERLVDLLPSGNIVFSVLSVDDHPAAFHFGLASGTSFLWYKPAFDRGLARYSPGEVLLGGLVRHAVEQGFEIFDFTRGNESFKSRFASDLAYNLSYARYASATSVVRHHFMSYARACLRTIRSRLRRSRPTGTAKCPP